MLVSGLKVRSGLKRGSLAFVLLYVLYCVAFNMPLLSSNLPEYSGPYKVGTVDIEAPCERRRVSDAVFKGTDKAAFELSTVLFSLYYPAVENWRHARTNHPWVENIPLQAEGYARFAGINNVVTNNIFSFALWTLVGSTTVPANVDWPLHGTAKSYADYEGEQPVDNYGLPRFPIIVFSHGQASSRTSYTQWCGELASRGYIVAAIEHRDGSGPGSALNHQDGSSEEVFLIKESQLDPEPDTPAFKAMQLAMRQAEIEETVRVLRLINAGLGADVHKLNAREEGSDLLEWRGRLNMDRIVVAGHSYGATGALQALKGAPSEKLPFVGGIILDPGKSSGPLNDDIKVPIVVVHSQSWSARHSIFHGRPHFDVVKDLVEKVNREEANKAPHFGWFLTAKGTTHPTVTDAPLIEPMLLAWTTGSTIDAREGVLQYVKISEEFMQYLEDGHRRGILAEEVTHPTYNKDIRDEKRKEDMAVNIAKYWQIHVSPSTFCPYPGLCGVEQETNPER